MQRKLLIVSTSLIVLAFASAANAQNSTTLNQNGTWNYAEVNQQGIWNNNVIDLTQYGDGNQVFATQDFLTTNSSITIHQDNGWYWGGNTARAKQEQISNSYANLTQSGADNTLKTYQGYGYNNYIIASQNGLSQSAELNQWGNNNTIWGTQQGTSNSIGVTQQGGGNFAHYTQVGSNNTASIYQH